MTSAAAPYLLSNPHHMTGAEHLNEIAFVKWQTLWKATLWEVGKVFKEHHKLIDKAEKNTGSGRKKALQEDKRKEHEAEKEWKDKEKQAEQEQKQE